MRQPRIIIAEYGARIPTAFIYQADLILERSYSGTHFYVAKSRTSDLAGTWINKGAALELRYSTGDRSDEVMRHMLPVAEHSQIPNI